MNEDILGGVNGALIATRQPMTPEQDDLEWALDYYHEAIGEERSA